MNFTLSGKVSIFGGPDDPGMSPMEGLALYEHHEADGRVDLFGPRVDGRGVAARLRPDAMYFAMRFPNIRRDDDFGHMVWEGWHTGFYRSLLQCHAFRLLADEERMVFNCWLVDFGPHLRTGRMFDLSPMLAKRMGVQTDDVVTLEIL